MPDVYAVAIDSASDQSITALLEALLTEAILGAPQSNEASGDGDIATPTNRNG